MRQRSIAGDTLYRPGNSRNDRPRFRDAARVTFAERCSLTDAAPQTTDGDQNRRPFEHLYQPVEKGFGVAVPWFKILFEDALGITNGFNGQFLIAHHSELHTIEPGTQLNLPQIVPEGSGTLLTAGCCMLASGSSLILVALLGARGAF
jgi:hypothetical protein